MTPIKQQNLKTSLNYVSGENHMCLKKNLCIEHVSCFTDYLYHKVPCCFYRIMENGTDENKDLKCCG